VPPPLPRIHTRRKLQQERIVAIKCLHLKLICSEGIQDEETCSGIKSKSSEGRVQCCHIAFVRNARLVVPVVVTCVGSGGLQRSYHGAA
jgi:hypothetical protein